MAFKVTIVGAGLAGSEACLVLSRFPEIQINLIEMRPKVQTEVHKTKSCAELVCSNSFKSLKWNSAAGMLKYELASLNSPLLECALNTKVDAGGALAVDRNCFSDLVSKKINESKNITLTRDEFVNIENEIQKCDALILVTGPLTSDLLSKSIQKITNQNDLYFYDAAAPIVMASSLNMNKIFCQDRYGDEARGDYLNAPMTKLEYDNFINELINAECVIKKNFETKELFQACQPIEEVAKTGIDAPRFGACKPIGLTDPNTGTRPYAVVQLRSENKEKTAYNLVGFQTNLKFHEQSRVFKMIPGLENAEFARFGVMHKNTFINSPQLLDKDLSLKKFNNIYIAGQLSGTEGYFEAVRSGHHVAISVISKMLNVNCPEISNETAFGSLLSYATDQNTKEYQPMHVNFGIMPPLDKKIRNKNERYNEYANRGKIAMDKYTNELSKIGILNINDQTKSMKLLNELATLWVKK